MRFSAFRLPIKDDILTLDFNPFKHKLFYFSSIFYSFRRDKVDMSENKLSEFSRNLFSLPSIPIPSINS